MFAPNDRVVVMWDSGKFSNLATVLAADQIVDDYLIRMDNGQMLSLHWSPNDKCYRSRRDDGGTSYTYRYHVRRFQGKQEATC